MSEIVEKNLHKDVVSAYKKASKLKETYRFEEGKRLIGDMVTNVYGPKVFIAACTLLGIHYVSFEKITTSADYMPDTGWYIILNRREGEPLCFLYSCTESYREFTDLFGIENIHEGDHLQEVLEESGVTLTTEEASEFWEFVIGYGSEGTNRDLYDYEGSDVT